MKRAAARIISPGVLINPRDEKIRQPRRKQKHNAEAIEKIRQKTLLGPFDKFNDKVKKDDRNENDTGVAEPCEQFRVLRVLQIKENGPTALPITGEKTPGRKRPIQFGFAIPGKNENAQAKGQECGSQCWDGIDGHVAALKI